MATKQITREQVRKIAREEAVKVQKELVKKVNQLEAKVDQLDENIKTNTVILQRLDRLLLGELGVETEDTLKARAIYAYNYAKRNTDLRVVERAIPALEWFEDMNRKEPGCSESKLDSLGKIISAYSAVKWLVGFWIGSTTIGLIPVIKMIIEWFSSID